ncbi:helix-turn-helix domain-containing protein [Photobacterium sp. GJ3]|uniref:sugar diacid recognition domain-containing protein n=1 Tax=Photobacterium sp. GJ3 TaxID=2829502 RepID=UPI001B8CF4FF|nr:sugar diacid recognition domain-containing protein [Photobacterium sp. GJ3]QUJ67969.1 helix-turn-helix domain-containing protein [Photobacterium sp. GJ3]
MNIHVELANEIVKRAMAIIHHNVNIIDGNGIIIASGHAKRIGQKHGAAIEAIKNGARITINNDTEASRYTNTEPGINHPIIIDGEVSIVIGISGNPVVIERFSELAILTAELLLKRVNEIHISNWKKRVSDNLVSEYIEYGETERGLLALEKLNYNSGLLLSDTVPVIIKIDIQDFMMTDVFESLLSKLSSFVDLDRIILLNHSEVLLLLPGHASISPMIEKAEIAVSSQLSRFKIGVGILANTPCDIRNSVILSRSVIEIGCKSNSKNRIYDFKNMAILCILKEIENSHLKSYFSQINESLIAHSQGEQIIETLDLFIQNNAELSKTATQLGIHRNTLSYRLSSIKKITALDPLKFMDLLQLSIAIHCYRKDHPGENHWIETII